MVGKNIRNYIQHFFVFMMCIFLNRICLACCNPMCICLSHLYLLYLMSICCTLCVFVYFMCICYTLCVLVVLCVYCYSYLNAGLLARSNYPEGPATGHLDTGFSCFPCVYKRMLRWFPSFQVATTCLSCSPLELNFLVTLYIYIYIFVYM